MQVRQGAFLEDSLAHVSERRLLVDVQHNLDIIVSQLCSFALLLTTALVESPL